MSEAAEMNDAFGSGIGATFRRRLAHRVDVTYKLRMPKRAAKTGFDKFVAEQMRSPSFASAYAEARAEVDAIDRIVRSLDAARQRRYMTKAELARAAGLRPEIVRRLFTAQQPNPTLDTLLRVMAAVGCSLQVVPLAAPKRSSRSHSAKLRGTRPRYSSPRRRTAA